MINAATWTKAATVEFLRRVLIGAVALTVLSASALGVSIYLVSRQTEADKVSAKSHEAALSELRAMVARANSENSSLPATGFGAVSSFQSAVEACAAEKGCIVTEFQAGAEIMPFITRFKKETAKNDWGQVEVQFTVRGKLVDVMNAVKSFADQPVPFEYNAVEVSRTEVDKIGSATVNARVSLRVLTRSAGGPNA